MPGNRLRARRQPTPEARAQWAPSGERENPPGPRQPKSEVDVQQRNRQAQGQEAK